MSELHPLVVQLRFARHSLLRCLEGVTEEDARRRLEPMNCLSWILGHLANVENRWWVLLAQGQELLPELNELVGYGKPASTPPLAEMRAAWQTITQTADRYLDTVTTETLQQHFTWKGKPRPESIGTTLLRCIYHYWYHIGEASAIRQLLGHSELPEYVGDMSMSPYQPE